MVIAVWYISVTKALAGKYVADELARDLAYSIWHHINQGLQVYSDACAYAQPTSIIFELSCYNGQQCHIKTNSLPESINVRKKYL